MKRMISEVIDLIKQKKENAEREKMRFNPVIMGDYISPFDSHLYWKNKGYEEAYTDVLCLLESSHLIEQDKAIEILKDKINIVGNDNLNYYQLSLKPDKCVGDTADIMLITKEEHKVLSEVLNDNNK